MPPLPATRAALRTLRALAATYAPPVVLLTATCALAQAGLPR